MSGVKTKKVKRIVLIIVLALFLIGVLVTYDMMKIKMNDPEDDYVRMKIEPVAITFPIFESHINECYYIVNRISTGGVGPADTYVRLYVILDEAYAKFLYQEYEWESIPHEIAEEGWGHSEYKAELDVVSTGAHEWY